MSNMPRRLQDLPPKQAHLSLGVERFFLKDLGVPASSGTRLLIACSGGVDSLALLVMFGCLAQRNGWQIEAAHLDHSLRPESATDAEHVATVCANLDIALHTHREDIGQQAKAQSIGLEEAGRHARATFFQTTSERIGAQYILTAHHLNDLAEDVLMRLTRGTAWPGLGGMPAFDPRRNLVRPLLLTPKKRLISFLQSIDVKWVEDNSNSDLSFTRNRIRSRILPLFLKENPNFLNAISRLWRLADIDAKYWQSVSAMTMDNEPGFLPFDALKELPQALRLRLYKTEADSVGAGQTLADTLFQLDAALLAQRPALFQFPGKKTATVSAQGIQFCSPDD